MKENRTHSSYASEKQRGEPECKIPQDTGLVPLTKHLGGKYRAPVQGIRRTSASKPTDSSSQVFLSRRNPAAPAQTQSRLVPASARMLHRAKVLAAQAAAEEVPALHFTPVAASRPATGFSGGPTDFGATHTSVQPDHGVA